MVSCPDDPVVPDLDRLVLRPWRDDDAPAVLTAFCADDMASQSGEQITDVAAAGRWIARWREAERAYPFAVVCAGRVVGHVAVSAVDRRHATGWSWVTA